MDKIKWDLRNFDVFDHSSGIEISGVGLETGFLELWQRTFVETPGFVSFVLETEDGKQVGIPLENKKLLAVMNNLKTLPENQIQEKIRNLAQSHLEEFLKGMEEEFWSKNF